MSTATDKPITRWLNKVPEITLAFWCSGLANPDTDLARVRAMSEGIARTR